MPPVRLTLPQPPPPRADILYPHRETQPFFPPSARFALQQAKGAISAADAASVKAQDSAVDGNQPDSTKPATEAVATHTQAQGTGGDASVANDSSSSSAGASGKGAAAGAAAGKESGGGQAAAEEEDGGGVLSGLADSVSGWFSKK